MGLISLVVLGGLAVLLSILGYELGEQCFWAEQPFFTGCLPAGGAGRRSGVWRQSWFWPTSVSGTLCLSRKQAVDCSPPWA